MCQAWAHVTFTHTQHPSTLSRLSLSRTHPPCFPAARQLGGGKDIAPPIRGNLTPNPPPELLKRTKSAWLWLSTNQYGRRSPPITSNASRDRCSQSEGAAAAGKIRRELLRVVYTDTFLTRVIVAFKLRTEVTVDWLGRSSAFFFFFAVRDNSTCSSRVGRAIKLSGVFPCRSASERRPYLQTSGSGSGGAGSNQPRPGGGLSITGSRDQVPGRPALFISQSSAESLPHLPTF